MKRIVLSLGIIAVVVACKKERITINTIPTVNKTVVFSIVPANNYSNASYNGATAEVKLSVYKQFSNPYSTEVIWDTVIAKQALSNYMNMPNPNMITKTFAGLKENEYRIGVGYSIAYISAPPLSANSWSAMGELIERGNITHNVQVGL